MGWSHLVLLVPSIHGEFLRRAGLDTSLQITEGNSRSLGEARYGRYIEDFFVFGSSKELGQSIYDKVWEVFEKVTLDPKRSYFEAHSTPRESILGI